MDGRISHVVLLGVLRAGLVMYIVCCVGTVDRFVGLLCRCCCVIM